MTKRYRYNRAFSGTREQVFQACLEAVTQCGFRIDSSSPVGGQIRAQTRVSFRSWGENIVVAIDSEGRVDIMSESKVIFTTNDWGKNEANVEKLFSRIALLLV